MRLSFFTALLLTVTFFLGYSYYTARAICPIPIAYRIGELDPKFSLSEEEARLAVADAESIWEDATGENLFTYDPDATFTVNFIYDERQAYTDAELTYRERLDETREVNDSISEQYAQLVASYNELQLTYSDQAEAYQRTLATYNADVARYNAEGGAPPAEYKKLESRRTALDHERQELNALSEQLNGLVNQINDLGQEGNKLVESYNTTVEQYNDTFGKTREFTQGTYHTDDRIDIYSFTTLDELQLVLAHELGHALSLEHVDNERSVMYYLISDQPKDLVLTSEDVAEFTAICGQRSVWAKIKLGVTNLINNIRQQQYE